MRGAFEMMDIEMDAFREQTLTSWLPWGRKKVEEERFDGFSARGGLLYAQGENIFIDQPDRMLRVFWHCQNRGFNLSPSLRKLIKMNLSLMDEEFCRSEESHHTIEMIMSMRGRVGVTLRSMHRMGVLGIFFPEFGALDCLVQHEFFHRYTADEHTLRCIEYLDLVVKDGAEDKKLFEEIFKDKEDPFALYLALLLHDTGRSFNSDDHVDGSHVLAVQACDRLKIQGERRKLILFLVDHHLTLFNIGTKKDIDDPEVITELCSEMKTVDRLEALFVFTYCDSSGTNPEGWSGWKALAIITLFRRAKQVMQSSSSENTEVYLKELLAEQAADVKGRLLEKYWDAADFHFDAMPVGYFRYRKTSSIAKHIKAVWQYQERRSRRPDTPFEAAVQWEKHVSLGYTEVSIVANEKKNLLASICCAMDSHGINILSANVHTRPDGIVLDVFRVCDMKQAAVTDKILQMQVVATIYKLNAMAVYDSAKYVKQGSSFMDVKQMLVVIPQVKVCNLENEIYTTVDVEASDRRGLLHDLVSLFAAQDFVTKGARIVTERNTAIDSFLLSDTKGKKLDDEMCALLHRRIMDVARG